MANLPILDPMFHQPVRTRLTVLLKNKPMSFSQLKLELQLTDGNLDAHLRKLASQGFLHSKMVMEGRPHTVYEMSESGIEAFQQYTSALTQIMRLIERKE